MHLLKGIDLNKSFGGLKAINNVSLHVTGGELCSIIGPNGAGKSTLFNLLTGYHPVDSGKIFFKDKEITSWSIHRRARLGVARAFQVSSIFESMTVMENIRTALIAQAGKAVTFFRPAKTLVKQETWEILETCGLLEKRDTIAANLSQGDKKLLELGIAIGGSPDMLFLDEPTAGMSAEEGLRTMQIIASLNRNKKLTILFTEHDMDVVFGYSQRVTVLHQGTIIAEGDPEAIRSNSEVQRVYLGEENRNA